MGRFPAIEPSPPSFGGMATDGFSFESGSIQLPMVRPFGGPFGSLFCFKFCRTFVIKCRTVDISRPHN